LFKLLRVKVGGPAVQSIGICRSRICFAVAAIVVAAAVAAVVRRWRVNRRRIRSLVLLLFVSKFIIFIIAAVFVEGVINIFPGAFLSLLLW